MYVHRFHTFPFSFGCEFLIVVGKEDCRWKDKTSAVNCQKDPFVNNINKVMLLLLVKTKEGEGNVKGIIACKWLLTSLWSEPGRIWSRPLLYNFYCANSSLPASLAPTHLFCPHTAQHTDQAKIQSIRTYADDPKTILENQISMFAPSEVMTAFLETSALKFLRAWGNLMVWHVLIYE